MARIRNVGSAAGSRDPGVAAGACRILPERGEPPELGGKASGVFVGVFRVAVTG